MKTYPRIAASLCFVIVMLPFVLPPVALLVVVRYLLKRKQA
jgi:hypothetical protein